MTNATPSAVHYTHRVTWSPEDGGHVATGLEFPSLIWLARMPMAAPSSARKMVLGPLTDMQAGQKPIPPPLAEKKYGGWIRPGIPPQLHRALAMRRPNTGDSLNRLASAKPVA